ncbi:hypothetical protein RSOLAG1IB_06442 [Rhizoctonia solani AG-1 IB]|uniref:Protein kinase domain-containing protein n=1 Tax=Thanatephorus cucumeris (strain AG1-IB / isolate 7/3/14) TaxID=1108050 RepID=A0A0B7FBL9_THACB|nr:hypothetical protein RSOLAG1IB_06442 [Rhizoctonia solani AG-1 IB]
MSPFVRSWWGIDGGTWAALDFPSCARRLCDIELSRLGESDVTSQLERMCVLKLEDALHELAKCRCPDLTQQVTFLGNGGDVPITSGFYDIYQASLAGYQGFVAVKLSAKAVLEHVVNELRVVSSLEHSNVLPCLGYIITELRGSAVYDSSSLSQQMIGIVYPWMDLNLRDYLKVWPEANRAYLCNQIIEGLMYLHNAGAIHGDLRSGRYRSQGLGAQF